MKAPPISTLALLSVSITGFCQELIQEQLDDFGDEFKACAVRDIDGDGNLDFVMDGIRIRWGESEGGVSDILQTLDPISDTTTVVVEDFDGDGQLDVACGSDGDNSVHLFRNLGNRTFELELIDSDRGTHFLTAMDMDRDGQLDLISVDRLGTGEVTWYRRRESGWAAQTIADAFLQPFAVVAANLDDDPASEVVVSDVTGYYVVDATEGDDPPRLHFGEPERVDERELDGRHLVTLDFDDDGDEDIVTAIRSVGFYGDTKVALFRNDGNLSFTYSELASDLHSVFSPADRQNYYRWIEAVDLEGDGDIDLAVSRFEGHRSRFLFLLNHGAGSFAPTEVMLELSQPWRGMYTFAIWPLPDGRNAILPGFDVSSLTPGSTRLSVPAEGLAPTTIGEASFSFTPGGQFDVTVDGPEATVFRVQFSEDLKTWSTNYDSGGIKRTVDGIWSSAGPVTRSGNWPDACSLYMRVRSIKAVRMANR